MAFPEGARGANKPFRKRYQLQRFGSGFMRLALETGAAVVPVGIVGAEEQQLGLIRAGVTCGDHQDDPHEQSIDSDKLSICHDVTFQ